MTSMEKKTPDAPAGAAEQAGPASGRSADFGIDTTAKTTGEAIRAYTTKLRGGDLGALPALLGLLALFILFTALASDTFPSLLNLANLLQQGAGQTVIAMGLVFAYVWRRTGRLWPLIVAHGIIDSVAYVGYALAAGHLGRSPPFGSPVLTKLAKYAWNVSDTLRSSGVHAYTVFEARLPIAYSISAEWTAPRGAGGRAAGASPPRITPPASPATALPIAAVIAGRGRE